MGDDPKNAGARMAAEGFPLGDLDYELPADRIAQRPAARRDAARMLVVPPAPGPFVDSSVASLPDFLRAGDLLVLNDTRVRPARFFLRRATGGVIEGLFLEEAEQGVWRVMLRGARRCRAGETLGFVSGADAAWTCTLRASLELGEWIVAVQPGLPVDDVLDRVGYMPLPPYIRRSGPGQSVRAHTSTASGHARCENRSAESADPDCENVGDDAGPIGATCDPAGMGADGDGDVERLDRQRYQTVYARVPGAVAAPTAGLHFTSALLGQVRDRGVAVATVTLHVGVGTFKPVSASRLDAHVMHEETYDLPVATAEAVERCRQVGGRVVAVGTTSVRTLEACAGPGGRVQPARGRTRLFIYPPYRFRVVDALLTNFHLPRSTLLALVMALGGTRRIREAYAHAIEHGYRFYSYGDAMFIDAGGSARRRPSA